MSVRLFIGNLPYAANEAELREHLSSVGAPTQSRAADRSRNRPTARLRVRRLRRSRRRRRSDSPIQPAAVQRPAPGRQRGASARGARPGGPPRPGGFSGPRPGGRLRVPAARGRAASRHVPGGLRPGPTPAALRRPARAAATSARMRRPRTSASRRARTATAVHAAPSRSVRSAVSTTRTRTGAPRTRKSTSTTSRTAAKDDELDDEHCRNRTTQTGRRALSPEFASASPCCSSPLRAASSPTRRQRQPWPSVRRTAFGRGTCPWLWSHSARSPVTLEWHPTAQLDADHVAVPRITRRLSHASRRSRLHGCAGHSAVAHFDMVQLDGAAPAIRWMAPELDADRSSLGNWRVSVGPPVVVSVRGPGQPRHPIASSSSTGTCTSAAETSAACWPTFAGSTAARRSCFCCRRRIAKGRRFRASLEANASFASMIRALRPDGSREEIESVAAAPRPARLLRALDAQRRRRRRQPKTAATPSSRRCRWPTSRRSSCRSSGSAAWPWRRRLPESTARGRAVEGPRGVGSSRQHGRRAALVDRRRRVRPHPPGARPGLGAAGRATPLVLGADLNSWFGFQDGAYRDRRSGIPGNARHRSARHVSRDAAARSSVLPAGRGMAGAVRTRADNAYGSDHYSPRRRDPRSTRPL